MWIYSHDSASAGATELAKALGAKKIKHEKSSFRGSPDKIVINWGASTVPAEVEKCRILNHPDNTVRASNKINFFNDVGGDCRVVPWTTSRDTANVWLRGGSEVVCRSIVSGSGGRGISFVEGEGELPTVPLYTKYIPKKHEYRVHFVNGVIVDYQRKALRPDVNKDDVDWRVRNLENGFIFVRGDVVLPDDVRREAQSCADCIDLEFGAIDLIYNEKTAMAYVLEVNTAPGLVGTTVTNYANAIRNLIESMK